MEFGWMPRVRIAIRSWTLGLNRRWLMAVAVIGVLAFVAQGSRGLWEPDEGFYSNVALHMAQSGEWLVPRLNGEIFLDKPPLHLWAQAIAMRVSTADGVLRSAHSLWFLGAALLLGALVGRLWERRFGPGAAVIYATMLAPFVATNILTPDTVLTFCVVAAFYCYWRWYSAPGAGQRALWALAAGCAGGLGILAKGPALLIFAFPLALHALLLWRCGRFRVREVAIASLSAAVIGGSWYAYICATVPGAFQYLFDSQIAGRLWSSSYQRNAAWSGPLKVYLPMVIAGSLPWTPVLARAALEGWRSARRAGFRRLLAQPEGLLIGLWMVVPLVVLSAARSRLPFYALPMMPALAAVAALSLGRRGWTAQRWTHSWRLAVWILLLVSLRLASGWIVSADDSGRLAGELRRAGIGAATHLVAVDLKCNALPVYGYEKLQAVRFLKPDYPFFSPPPRLRDIVHSLPQDGPALFLAKGGTAVELEAFLDWEIGPCDVRNDFGEVVVIECGALAGAKVARAF
jgi:4-amino-4-deoxy-L-arabinose transferase